MTDITVQSLSDVSVTHFEAFLRSSSSAIFNHTASYRDLLDDVLDAEPRYFVATTGDQMVGALPTFVTRNDAGSVVNSLPFFGSQGGLVTRDGLDGTERAEVGRALMAELDRYASDDTSLSVLISSPLRRSTLQPAFRDVRVEHTVDRIAQIVDFGDTTPPLAENRYLVPDATPQLEDATNLSEHLFATFESRCRRAIRKAEKSDVEVVDSTDFDRLFEMHKNGMEAIDGTVKPKRFFDRIDEHVPRDRYSLTYALHEGEVIGGLLLFYFNNTVEYYTPAYESDHRNLQPTSLLIYRAMIDAIDERFRYFNFGGTRESQESLYRFKRGWGAEDFPYKYRVVAHDDLSTIRSMSPEQLSREYEWFYVVPYDELTA